MKQVSRELLRAARGSRSQRKLSRQLGYRSNPVEQWENGRSFPTAAVAFRAIDKCGIDVRAALERFVTGYSSGLDSFEPDAVARWLQHTKGELKQVELARRMGRPPMTVSRWLRGVCEPKLPEVLQWVEVLTRRIPEFVAELVPVERVPSVADRFGEIQRLRALRSENQLIPLLRMALRLNGYAALERHDDAWLARLLREPVEVIRSTLQDFIDAGMAEWDGTHYRLVQVTAVADSDPEVVDKMRQWWIAKVLDRARTPAASDLFTGVLISSTPQAIEQVRGIMMEAVNEARAVGNAAASEDDLALLTVQLVGYRTSDLT